MTKRMGLSVLTKSMRKQFFVPDKVLHSLGLILSVSQHLFLEKGFVTLETKKLRMILMIIIQKCCIFQSVLNYFSKANWKVQKDVQSKLFLRSISNQEKGSKIQCQDSIFPQNLCTPNHHYP